MYVLSMYSKYVALNLSSICYCCHDFVQVMWMCDLFVYFVCLLKLLVVCLVRLDHGGRIRLSFRGDINTKLATANLSPQSHTNKHNLVTKT